MCEYIYIYIYIYIFIHIRIHTHVQYVYIYIYIHMYIHIQGVRKLPDAEEREGPVPLDAGPPGGINYQRKLSLRPPRGRNRSKPTFNRTAGSQSALRQMSVNGSSAGIRIGNI